MVLLITSALGHTDDLSQHDSALKLQLNLSWNSAAQHDSALKFQLSMT